LIVESCRGKGVEFGQHTLRKLPNLGITGVEAWW